MCSASPSQQQDGGPQIGNLEFSGDQHIIGHKDPSKLAGEKPGSVFIVGQDQASSLVPEGLAGLMQYDVFGPSRAGARSGREDQWWWSNAFSSQFGMVLRE